MTAEHWNSDAWMDDVAFPSPEWDRRMGDAESLQRWLYRRLDRSAMPVAVSEAASALGWDENRTLEAAQAHYWTFVTEGDGGLFLDVDGE